MTDNTDWWFNEVEGTFGFLVAELDFEVSERYRHFKGNYIAYARSDATLAIECPPDWNDLWGWVAVGGPDGTWTGQHIADLLDGDDPTRPSLYAGDSGPLDREAIASKMTDWAAGFRRWVIVRESTAGCVEMWLDSSSEWASSRACCSRRSGLYDAESDEHDSARRPTDWGPLPTRSMPRTTQSTPVTTGPSVNRTSSPESFCRRRNRGSRRSARRNSSGSEICDRDARRR